jgi:hypothetical protein
VLALVVQFHDAPLPRARQYWFLAFAIAIAGTGSL